MNKRIITYLVFTLSISILFFSCSANNCPLESNVTCNYGFYDSEGTPITYNDVITVTTLLSGSKTVYTYKKLNMETVVLDYHDESYIQEGYVETVSEVRRDTVLLNKISNISSMKLPMSYYSKNDTIIISYSSISNKDTIFINHNSYTYVDLPECGTKRFHTIKEIRSTESGIYNVEIADASVNFDGNENIKIYFNGIAE